MAYVPDELRLYHPFHEAINNFTWLLKARWAPKVELQAKRFRLDLLMQGYAEQHVVNLNRVRRSLANPKSAVRDAAAEASLQKVWFNELAYASPQLPEPLILDSRGVQANYEASSRRLIFAPWPIATLGGHPVDT